MCLNHKKLIFEEDEIGLNIDNKDHYFQQEVFFGLTKTVLLCLALEYSEIWVDLILCAFLAISGFSIMLSLKWLSSWFVCAVVWLRLCLQSEEEYWEVFRMLFSICGEGFLDLDTMVLSGLERSLVHGIPELLFSTKFLHFIQKCALIIR